MFDKRFYMLREQATRLQTRGQRLRLKAEGLRFASQNPDWSQGAAWCVEPEDRRIGRAMDAGPVRSVGGECEVCSVKYAVAQRLYDLPPEN